MTFGEKLQSLRKQKGLSQEQLAAQMTVSRQAVSKWELGESMPDTENIIQLSRLFAVTTDYLLHEEYADAEPIPAATPAPPTSRRIAAFVCLAVGFLGLFTLLLCASLIPASKTVKVPAGLTREPVSLSGEVAPSGIDQSGMTMYTGMTVRGYLWAFLETYHLMWLFVLCCLSVAAGAWMLLRFPVPRAFHPK
ncbi:MAG: helix-turn-helix domain-containing protein [Oscillospiraceae bacterium]|jgi:transcriptional regulator with XRE-family HTH domain|nr:helix-turn-helix domain-containing protein [Oscillospiraceae bacterium]